MILTCPSCGTRYVVKDGAIPDGGRTVRCAQCKHSWHQEPPPADPVEDAASETPFAVPASEPSREEAYAAQVEQGPVAAGDQIETATERWAEPEKTDDPQVGMLAAHADEDPPSTPPQDGPIASDPPGDLPANPPAFDAAPDATEVPDASAESERTSHPLRAAMDADDIYSPFADRDEDEQTPRRKWPFLLLGGLALVAMVAAAIWFFAPPEFKSRLGIAQASDATRLTVQVQQHGRRQLASGNQLFEVSGIVANETDDTLAVPPLNAQLRSLEQQIVYRWTIPLSQPQLPPGERTSFHSANLDIPPAAACLEVFFGEQRRAPVCRDGAATGA